MDASSPNSPAAPPRLDAGQNYATRNNAFTSAATWKLAGGTLTIEDDRQHVRTIDLAQVAALKLEFAPTRPEPRRFRCRLILRGGTGVEFFNRTYRGVHQLMDTSADYRRFVLALHVALARHAPDCRFMAGASPAAYWFNAGLLGVLGAVLLVALVFFITAGMLWVVLIQVLLILFYVPTAINWVRRNKPRRYTSGTIPPDLLPR